MPTAYGRLALLGLAGLLVSACGQEAAAPVPSPAPPAAVAADAALPPVEPAEVTGHIDITGSSTVYPLTAAVAEAFATEGGAADISIQSTGTGGGFNRFCTSGATDLDIVNASRAITPEEQQTCVASGREPVGFRVGTDGLAVVVHPQNTFVQSLTIPQLAQIFSGEAATWADLDPSFPAEPIVLLSPGADSGTFDYFVETVFDGDASKVAATATTSEDDQVLVDGVVANPNAIAYFGFAYYDQNRGALRDIPIDGGSGVVAPTVETVGDGSYPLSRPLYIYTTREILQGEPDVAAFVNYYLQNVDDLIAEAGYFPAGEAALAEARRTFLAASASAVR